MNVPPRPVARRLFAGLLSIVLLACSIPSNHAADEAKLHEELKQLKTVYENAINTGNLAPLEALFTPESSGVVVDNQSFKTFADLRGIYDRFHASFPGVVYKITLNPDTSQIFGDLAVAHGTADESVKTDQGEFSYTSTFTAVLRRTDSGWKLIRSQVTMDPFRSSIVQHFLSRTKLYYGLGALVLGLLVGFGIGRMSGSRQSSAA